ASLYLALLSAEKIDQNKLREICGVGKVGLAVRHRGHLFDELYEVVITRKHKRINHDAGFAAGLDFAERCSHYPRIATHGVFVESPVGTECVSKRVAGRMPANRRQGC